MKKPKSEKTKLSVRIFSGIFFLIGLVILTLIGISLGKEAYHKKKIKKEIEGLESQISQLRQENSEMDNLISYLSTTDFKEREAREKLNLQKNSEKMIVLRKEVASADVKNESSSDSTEKPSEDTSPNWQKWWKFFFGNKH